MQKHSKTVIVVCGPTGVGKTAVSIQLAKAIKSEIINADSRQIYSELNIGVAKPSPNELATIKHHLIGTIPVSQLYGAGDFERDAIAIAKDIFKTSDQVILCGGTGMYIKAFCEGLDELPGADLDYRNQLQSEFEKNGIEYLQDELIKLDPQAQSIIDFKNPQRLMRALEMMRISGKKYSELFTGKKAVRDFSILKIGIHMDREKLYQQINNRVIDMMKNGLMDEVITLKSFRNCNALKTVGYTELFECLDGKLTEAQAVNLIQQHTRNYAKRQLTWFNADKEINWFYPDQIEQLITFVTSRLNETV